MSLHQALLKLIPTQTLLEKTKSIYHLFKQKTIHSTKTISTTSQQTQSKQPMYWLTYGGPFPYYGEK